MTAYVPQPKQKILHCSKSREILYGGAAGGGKSHSMRWDAIMCCLENAGCDAYLFRRTRTDLEHTHIKRIKAELPDQLGRYNETRNRWEFPNGSYLNMCYAEHENDVYKYDSVEFHWLGLDEAGHFSREMLSYLKTRLRVGGWEPKQDFFPRMIMSANPGGVSHVYLKNRFIKGRSPEVLEIMNDRSGEMEQHIVYPFQEKGRTCLFIPASMRDNIFIDDDYENQFDDIPDYKRRQLVDGDWDVIPGAFFDCWDPRIHVIRPFEIPPHWTRFMAIDWGFRQPFWIGEFTVVDGEWEDYEEGTNILTWEWYGSDKPYGSGNKGLRMDAYETASRILETRGRPDYVVAGHDMWKADLGPSSAEKFARAGFTIRQADYQRPEGWAHMYAMIKSGKFYAFENCQAAIQCIPTLEMNPDKPEDIAKKGEDHPGDGVRYGLMSRPFVKERPPEKINVPRFSFENLLTRPQSNPRQRLANRL